MIINRKIRRTFMENKSQYMGSIILISLCSMMFFLFNLLFFNMDYTNNKFKESYVQEDANFIVENPLENLEDIERNFDLIIEERFYSDYINNEGVTLRIFPLSSKINKPAVIEGDKLSTMGEINLDPYYAKAHNLSLDNKLLINNMDFKIKGFISLPDYVYPIKNETDLMSDAKNFGIAIISREDFNSLDNKQMFYSLKLNSNNEESFKEYLNSNNKILNWMSSRDNGRINFVDAKIKSIKDISFTLPLSILLLTIFLVDMILWRMIKKEYGSMGTLMALGYRKSEIIKHYLNFSIIIGVLGSMLGLLLGILLLNPMIKFFISYFNIPFDHIIFDVKYVFISLAFPLVMLMSTTLLVLNLALKHTPLDLIKGNISKDKISFLDRRLKLSKLKFNNKFRIRETINGFSRNLLLIFGIAVASMLLLLGFSSKNSIDYFLQDNYENVYSFKYDYLFSSIQNKNSFNLINSKDKYSLAPFYYGEEEKNSLTLLGIDPSSDYINLRDLNGSKLPIKGTTITKSLADKLKISKGDSINIKNKLDSKYYEFKVDNISPIYIGDFIIIPLDEFNALLNYEKGSFMGIRTLEPINKGDLKGEYNIFKITNIEEIKSSFNLALEPLKYSIGAMSFISFIIALIIVYIISSLAIEENKLNISLMEILGYHKNELASLILNSNILLVIMGYIISIPLIITSLEKIMSSATKDINISFPIVLDTKYIFIGFFLIITVYKLASSISKKKLFNVDMSEILKNRE
ncbi:ABC transporter permease [Clostridium amazonitimonense]|uniref:ABC transporter permease n=1 Tax=Clostridium amazonitimonense TaxID=1499689 RepID=UPI000509E4D7|nr:FtsX-like permease family protein [Clostridium amazonitimonense]